MSNTFVLCVALLAARSEARPVGLRAGRPGTVVRTLPAPALEDSAVGQRGEVTVALHALGRWAPGGALPVIYLPGFDAGPDDVRRTVLPELAAAVKEGRLPPLVLAVVDGRNALGGGFYAGAWTTWLAEAVPAALQGLGLAASPLLVGHSMGGLGALQLAAAYPGHFAGVVAVSPVTGLEAVAGPGAVASAARGLSEGRGPGAWVRRPTASHFRERLLWAAVAAWAHPAAGRWAAALSGGELAVPTREALADRLEPDRAFARPEAGFCELPILLSVGRGDTLVSEPAVQRLGAALHAFCPASRVRVTVHDGDHLSRLPADVVQGLDRLVLQ